MKSTFASNPFPAKGFPIDESNRLALDRVKSVSALSAHSAVKGSRQLRQFNNYELTVMTLKGETFAGFKIQR